MQKNKKSLQKPARQTDKDRQRMTLFCGGFVVVLW
jgi:hypothetical protein